MADAIQFEDGIGRKELLTIRRRFLNLQRERLRRIQVELRPQQRLFVDLLPLLFHINHPMLPGFVATNVPAGIPDYTPTQALLRNARKLSRSFKYKKRARRRYDISGLYLMGSVGSIAHTKASDLDIWLCHSPQLSPSARELLQQKAEHLEAWAAELDLEAHIFLIDPENFRLGKRDALSHESSGSTQPHLLLEEFYRTGILLAGRYPLWWLVPPEHEGHYREYTRMLIDKRFVDQTDVIDFGGLESLPAEEFFGSAHWQLYKGVEAPYKSILKLLLIESYAQDYPRMNWLSQELKRAIYSGTAEVDDLDPYILMYRRVDRYLTHIGAETRLDLARRCLYFKSEQYLSRGSGRANNWKRERLQQLADEWRWTPGRLTILDERAHWKIDRVLNERKRLVQELTHSYRLLTDFARIYGDKNDINPRELTLLGRKLYTAMEKRPGKVDSINPGISQNLLEPEVSLHRRQNPGGDNGWFLYLGEINSDRALVTSPIKSTLSLVEMLTWCHLNQVINLQTQIHLYPKEILRHTELMDLLRTLEQIFPAKVRQMLLNVPIERLSAAPFATRFCLFVNIGHDPLEHLSRQGMQLTTERHDILSFGGAHNSLVQKIDLLYTTSWGETLVQHQDDSGGLLEIICQYLRLTLLAHPDNPPPLVQIYSYSSVRARAIMQRLEQLFSEIAEAFFQQGPETRFLLQADTHLYLLKRQGKGFTYLRIEQEGELIDTLSEELARFSPLVADSLSLQETPLPLIYRHNRENQIQLFYLQGSKYTELYILDEHGALFHQQMSHVDEHYLLVQQQRFLNGLLLMRNLTDSEIPHHLLFNAPEFYRLVRDRNGEFAAEPRTPPRHNFPDNYMELRLVSENLDLHHSRHYLICGDQEFSSLTHGEQIYNATTEYILSQRKGNQTYPIYLTGLELSNPPPNGSWSTILLLKFKKRLEARLNHALGRIAGKIL